jgi:hypothetical protein
MPAGGGGGAVDTISHDDAAATLAEHLRPVSDPSPDDVYLWLGEEHRICRERFPRMFGYDSPDELNDTPHLLQLVRKVG